MDIQFSRVRLSVRFRSLFFPAQLSELMSFLRLAGYEVLVPRESIGPVGGSVRMEVSGPIASKGVSVIDVNMERGILGVTSPSVDQTDGEFEALEAWASKLIGASEWVWFYETIVEGSATADAPAIIVIEGLLDRAPILASMAEVWGEPVTNFGLRLTPLGRSPNQEEWIDIKIEPDVRRAEAFIFEAVSRSREKNKVIDFLRHFPARLQSTFRMMWERT